MNYRPEISTDGGKTFGQNAQVFASKGEAEVMARDIFNRWMLATDYRAAETEDPVNYRIRDGVAEPFTPDPHALTESEGGEHD